MTTNNELGYRSLKTDTVQSSIAKNLEADDPIRVGDRDYGRGSIPSPLSLSPWPSTWPGSVCWHTGWRSCSTVSDQTGSTACRTVAGRPRSGHLSADAAEIGKHGSAVIIARS